MEPDEQAQSLAVIDVESEAIDNCVEPEKLEETEQWYSALQIQGLLRLSKAGLQQSICKLSEHLRIGHPNLTPWRCTSYPILGACPQSLQIIECRKTERIAKTGRSETGRALSLSMWLTNNLRIHPRP